MISDVYFPRINGVSTSIQTFRREFIAAGHHVTLIAPDYGGSATDDDPDILRIPSRGVILDPEDRMLKGRRIKALQERLRAERYDILHIQTPFVAHYVGVRLARALGIPVVESYHTFFEEYLYCYIPFLPRRWLRFVARRLSSLQCNRVDALVVPSSAMLEALRRYGVNSEAAIIPTGMELERFRGGDRAAFRRRHGIPDERPVLLYVGRVAFEKNIGFLVDMLAELRARLPEVLLVVAGEGPARASLERRAQEAGLAGNVLFIGYLERERELLDCYRGADVFTFASRTETQGLVLLEAMALGVPVVSTAVMGTRDILAAGRGALVAEETHSDFAAKVARLFDEQELRSRLGEEGRAYVEEWSASRLATRMVEFYGEILSRHGRTAAVLN